MLCTRDELQKNVNKELLTQTMNNKCEQGSDLMSSSFFNVIFIFDVVFIFEVVFILRSSLYLRLIFLFEVVFIIEVVFIFEGRTKP